MRPVLLTLVFIFFLLHHSYGCDCYFRKFKEDYKAKNNIILARVVHIDDSEADRNQTGITDSTIGYKATIKITEVLKGNHAVNETIYLTSNLSTCAYIFKNQVEYVLFLEEKDGLSHVTICSYNNSAAYMESKIKKMRKWGR